MTANWEAQLEAISEKRLRYHDFMLPLQSGLTTLLTEVEQQQSSFNALKGLGQNRFQRRKPKARRVRTQTAAK